MSEKDPKDEDFYNRTGWRRIMENGQSSKTL